MSLRLSHRWEHALLATVVAEASKTAPYVGRTAIQKLLYFINVLDVPMRYDFDIHHYGPFCSGILSDVEWLEADDVIKNTSTNDKYSNYQPGIAFTELQSKFKKDLEKHLPTIRSVVRALGDMKPGTLELIATLDFCFRWVSARGGNGPWKPETVAKFKSIKKDKFTDQEIDSWYSALVEAGLIKP